MVYAVIMAGGSGTRFWPSSTKKLPKQFLSLFGDGTMIQNTAKRIEPIIPQERILVVTNDRYVDLVKEQLPKVPDENIVGEPVAKNTAPCVAIAAEMLFRKDPDATMVVLPADHHITDPNAFNEYLKAAINKAESGNYLVTMGIKPNRPETGYGYIHGNREVSETFNKMSVHPVHAFKEKPDLNTAKSFLESGDYYWNSGMFIWSVKSVLQAFKSFLPEMYELVKKTGPALYTSDHTNAIDQFYLSCESVSIDYGIMEDAENVFVVPGEFGWNDVGSWTAAYDLGEKDNAGNVKRAKYITAADSRNNLISSSSKKMISLVGVEGLAVVETEDAILVCKLDDAQKVKDIVEQLKSDEELHKFL